MLYKKDGKIKERSRIIIFKDDQQIINPTDEMVIADGWVEYVAPDPVVDNSSEISKQLQDALLDQYNKRTDITDEDALKRPLLVYEWDTYIGKSLKTGQIVSYKSKLYRVRQDISTVIESYAPQLSTASLYEVIEVASAGTIDDPIPYTPPMEIFNGKYYTQNGVKYKCIRDSQTALSHNLADLVALYVEVV
mgnify:FL=1